MVLAAPRKAGVDAPNLLTSQGNLSGHGISRASDRTGNAGGSVVAFASGWIVLQALDSGQRFFTLMIGNEQVSLKLSVINTSISYSQRRGGSSNASAKWFISFRTIDHWR